MLQTIIIICHVIPWTLYPCQSYFKITELREGNCFGEVAFKNENSLRTASIFTNTSCSFAYLDVENYILPVKGIN